MAQQQQRVQQQQQWKRQQDGGLQPVNLSPGPVPSHSSGTPLHRSGQVSPNYFPPRLSPAHTMTTFETSSGSASSVQPQTANFNSPGYSVFQQQQQLQQSPYQQQFLSNPASPAFGYQAGTPDAYSGQANYRPPISVFTGNGTFANDLPGYNAQMPFPMSIQSSAPLSASSLAFLAGGAALDPTSIVYDENSGGYATPSYAGSYADDSSFDDRRSASPFSSKSASRNGAGDGSQQHTLANQQVPGFGTSQDLLAFREQHRRPQDWDDISSVAGGSVAGGNEDVRSSPAGSGAPGSTYASPAARLLDDKAYGGDGNNGLEMAYERMFAPLPSPKLLNRQSSQGQSHPTREDTLRASSHSPPVVLPAEPTLTLSPAQSPNLSASTGPPIPVFSTLSPSPTSPAFRSNVRSASPAGGPTLRSPPLPHGLQQSEPKTGLLAPLAIPLAPDLTLTAATPTAMPRSAVGRQDSTQAALDTVFSTFFEKSARRNDSTDSMPSGDLAPAQQQALFNMPKAADLTLNLESSFRKPIRQRSKSDTYMTSPINFESGSGVPNFSFGGFSDEQASPGQQSQQQEQQGPQTIPESGSSGIDPRSLNGSSAPGSSAGSPRQQIPLDTSAVADGAADSDFFGKVRLSQAGPSPAFRRKSAAGTSPYDTPTLAANLSPSAQDFLVPPSPMRRSRSHSGSGGHRRGVRSEDFTSTSSYSPMTANFFKGDNASISVPYGSDLATHFLGQTITDLPPMPRSEQAFIIPPLPQPAHESDNNVSNPYYQGQQQPDYNNLPQMPQSAFGSQSFYDPSQIQFDNQANGYGMQQPLLPSGYPNFLATPGFENPYPQHQLPNVYAPLEEDYSNSLEPPGHANRGRRRSSVNSATSGWSGAGSENITFESKTTEATKQAARRRRKDPNNAKFACEYCGETFTRAYNLKGHIRSHEGSKPFVCETCGKGFARRHDLKRHELLHTGVKKYQCEACQTPFVRLDALQRHHKSENGAACIAQIQAQATAQGITLEDLQGYDLRGVQL